MINLELYRVFYAVAKRGSLTKAARELYISQPAVSQSIKQLESRLGTSLFNRTHHGMELSSGGKLIYKKVEEALSLIENAEDAISELKTTPTGTVRIGATDSIFSHILADKITAFNKQYPQVKFELISSTTPHTVELLRGGQCDVAFLNLPSENEGIKFLGTVAHLTDVFVANERYSSFKDGEIPLSKLQELPLLMIERNTVARAALASFCRTLGIKLTPDIELSNWDLMLSFVKSGMGIGCIPREYCEKELSSGELFEIKTIPALPVRGVGVAVPADAPISYAVKEFLGKQTVII